MENNELLEIFTEWLEKWRESNGVYGEGVLSVELLEKFVGDLQDKILEIPGLFDKPEVCSGEKLVLYTGVTYTEIEEYCEANKNDTYFISQTKALFLWESVFQEAICNVIGEKFLFDPITARVLSGKCYLDTLCNTEYVRIGNSATTSGNYLALDDFLSENLAKTAVANGAEVIYVIGDTAKANSVGMLTEMPATLNDLLLSDGNLSKLTVVSDLTKNAAGEFVNTIDISNTNVIVAKDGTIEYIDFLNERTGSVSSKLTCSEYCKAYKEIGVGNITEAIRNSKICFDINGNEIGVDYRGTALEGIAKEPIIENSEIVKVKQSEYFTNKSKFTSENISSAIKESTIYLDERGKIIGRSYEGTVLEGKVSDTIPEKYSYSVKSERYNSYLDDNAMKIKYGETYETLTATEKYICREFDYIYRVSKGEIAGDSYTNAMLRYVESKGVKFSELNNISSTGKKILFEMGGKIYESAPVKALNKIYEKPIGEVKIGNSFSTEVSVKTVTNGVMRVAGTAMTAYACYKLTEDAITRANTAVENGDYGTAAGIVVGRSSQMAVTFIGGEVLSGIIAPELAAMGFAIGGPIGGAIGGFVGCCVSFVTSSVVGEIVDEFCEAIGEFWDFLFGSASTSYAVDPLVLDFDGDGFEILSVKDGVYFDEDGIGLVEKTAWVSGDDALLAIDLNGNNNIDDGSELFGTSTRMPDGKMANSGFEALLQYDSNLDGKIDDNDEAFSKILIWQDKNSDGISCESELKTLKEVGITSISLNYNSETGRNVSLVSFEDGTNTSIGEFDFEAQYYNVKEKEKIEYSEDIEKLPDVRAIGKVESLHTLMKKDETGVIKKYVESFVASESKMEKEEIVEKLLFFITGACEVDSNRRGRWIDAKILTVVEKFMGRDFVGTSGSNPVDTAALTLRRIYNDIVETYYCLLNSQTQLENYMNLVQIVENEDGTKTINTDVFDSFIQLCRQNGGDMSGIVAEMGHFIKCMNKTNTKNFNQYIIKYLGDEEYIRAIGEVCFSNQYIATDDNKSYYGTNIDDVLLGNSGNDCLYGYNGSDILYGDKEDDKLYGGEGNDILYGGVGNDYLDGGEGNDIYVFNLGDGEDVIIDCECSTTSGREDKIVFGEGIKAEDVSIERVGVDLVIKYSDTDKITVRNAYDYYDGRYYIEDIEFSGIAKYSINYNTLSLELTESYLPIIVENIATADILSESIESANLDAYAENYIAFESSSICNEELLVESMANLVVQEMSEITSCNVTDISDNSLEILNDNNVQLWVSE